MDTIELIDPATARRAIFLAKAYSHPLRSKILEVIAAAEPKGTNVTGIYTHPVFRNKQTKLYLEQSVCSAHLAWLKKYKLISAKRQGKQMIYTLNADTIARTGELMKEMAKLAA